MSDAANVTSTDNNGDSGLNGKLNATELLAVTASQFVLSLRNFMGYAAVFVISLLWAFNVWR